jgi:hypothetical protein
MSDTVEFSFDNNDDKFSGSIKTFKPKKGEFYRISLVWWDGLDKGDLNLDAPSPKFVGGLRHFLEGVGYFLSKGNEYVKLAGKDPAQVIATMIAIWPTFMSKNELKIDPDRLKAGEVDVLPWIFSKTKYSSLKERHHEFHFGKYDLKIKCEDEKFQKLDMITMGNSLLRGVKESKDQTIYKSIIEKAQEYQNKMESYLGQNLTLDQIRERMGMGSTTTASAGISAGTENIDSLIDNLG